MKSTAPDIINNGIIGVPHQTYQTHPDKWKALPFLVLMFTSGLPLNYTLQPARPVTVADAAEMTLAATSSGSSIFFVLLLAGLYGFSGWMLLKNPKVVGALLMQLWPLTFLFMFIALSILWSYEQAKVFNSIIHNVGTALIAIAAALYYRHDPWSLPKHLGYVLGANMLIHIAAVLVMPSYTIDWQGRWHGLTTHPNTLGAMALTTLWANAAVLIAGKSGRVLPHLLFSAAAIVAMIGADSVTSMLVSLFVLMAIYLLHSLHRRGAGQQFYVSVLVIISLAILIGIMAGNALDLSGFFALFGRDSDLTGRTAVWRDAVKAIAAHPLIGWSFDDHAYLIQQGMPYPTYHNGLLDVAVSGGAISVILFFLLLLIWAIGFGKSARISQQIAPYSASFVMAYMIHNLTESSLIAPRGQLWQIFLVLIFLGACKKMPILNLGKKRKNAPLPPLQIDTVCMFHEKNDHQSAHQPDIGRNS